MKKEKIFNKIVFTSILLILCYFCSCVNVYADCKEKKYHPSSTIAGVGDDNYYPIVKTVINLDETLSSDAEKNAYGKVIFSVSSAVDGAEKSINLDKLECSNDNNNFVKGCSGINLSTSKAVYIRLSKTVNTAKFTVSFVGNEKNAEVPAKTNGYCKDDITLSVVYEGISNAPKETPISYNYEPVVDKTFGKIYTCKGGSYSSNFERDFCKAYKGWESQGSKKVNPSSVESLSCDYNNIYYQSELKGSNYYKNTKYLYHSNDLVVEDGLKDTEGNYIMQDNKYVVGYFTYDSAGYTGDEAKDAITCKKTCQEVLEIKYGPPVVSKAGMCFEYKVKIISRVNCYSELDYKPYRNNIPICTPSPTCIHNGDEYNTAGPDGVFDSCIRSCDGGKYTSKCSKSCYKKIYRNNKKSISSNYGSLDAIKLSNEKCEGKANRLCDNDCNYCSNGPKKSDYESYYSADYFAESKPNRGYYYRSGSSIFWTGDANKSGCYNGNGTCFKFRKYVAGRWYAKTSEWGYYSADYGVFEDDGFYRGVTGTGYCHDWCSWGGCPTHSYLNEDDYFDTITKNKKALETAKNKCKVNSVCTTSTSTVDKVTFEIKAGDNKIPSSGADYINYKYNGWSADSRKNNSTTLMYDTFDDNGLVSCYDTKSNNFFKGVTSTVNTSVSRATWHFPGTWFDPKTNLMSYTPHDGWYVVKDKYCTSTETKNVNVKWWNYYVNKMMKDDSKKSDRDKKYEQKIFTEYDAQCNNTGKGTISDPVDVTAASYKPDMNIVASTRGFGLFGWNIDVNCFYALNTCLNGYKIRSISTADVFPSKEGTPITKDEKIGREPGYNWSNSSIVSKNENYVVNPPRLITEVQHFGQAGKDAIYKDENLEYSFNLSSLDMKSIRDKFESEKSDNYNIYNGKVYDPNKKSDLKVIYNGIPRYKSDLIEDLVKSGKGKRPPGDGFICNNIKNLSTGECDDYSSYKPASTK